MEKRYSRRLTKGDTAYLHLALEALGLKSVSSRDLGVRVGDDRVWYAVGALDRSFVKKVLNSVQECLSASPGGTSRFELIVQASKHAGRSVSEADLDSVLALIPGIEASSGGGLRQALHLLPSLPRMAERILYDADEPRHFKEIARAINHAHVIAGVPAPLKRPEALAPRLSADPAFESIGRSGLWKLAGWADYRTESIVELMREALEMQQRPCQIDELLERVKVHRADVTKDTMSTLVSMRGDLFSRLARKEVALVAWETRSSGYKSRQAGPNQSVAMKVMDAAQSIVRSEQKTRFPRGEFMSKVQALTGLSPARIQVALGQAPGISVLGSGSHSALEIEESTLFEGRAEAARRVAPIRATIEMAVQTFLAGQPDGRAPLNDVCQNVIKSTGTKRPTVYAAVARMSGVRKTIESKVTYCHLTATASALPMPGVDAIADKELRAELELVRKLLTPDSIAAGLMHLGSMLEHEIKATVREARATGRLEVTNAQVATPNTMITTLGERGVVVRPHRFHVLRELRNEIAHEHTFTQEARERLMRLAPQHVEYFVACLGELRAYRKRMSSIS